MLNVLMLDQVVEHILFLPILWNKPQEFVIKSKLMINSKENSTYLVYLKEVLLLDGLLRNVIWKEVFTIWLLLVDLIWVLMLFLTVLMESFVISLIIFQNLWFILILSKECVDLAVTLEIQLTWIRIFKNLYSYLLWTI